ncbi:uncharacterized protein LOC126780625 [Nymphalis io]|uniref:uncharacterized protein LOC126780625 n=1 Tax=Inachis io TaxID=171585 RepID=UPI002167982E|nr:uncharacterized protein LOC126780625 [Nymphalis io]
MDRPSTSGSTSFIHEMDTDAVDNFSNFLRRRKSSVRRDRRSIESVMDVNNSRYFARNIRSIIIECEMRIKGYLKLQRLATIAQDYNIFDIDDDSSNSSSISLDSSAENILANSIASPRPRFWRQVKKEKLTIGSWLFLSSVVGGWNYANTKNFLKKEIKCQFHTTIQIRRLKRKRG